MRPTTVGDVLTLIDSIAPFGSSEPWDNPGLLLGSRTSIVTKALCALDCTEDVADEAERLGAELIVTHHPILFRGRKNLCEDDAEGRLIAKLIRGRIALIAAHTCWDVACPGVNDALAERLMLKEVVPVGTFLRVGQTKACAFASFGAWVEERLHTPVRVYGDPDRIISRVAVLGGSGGDFAREAVEAGADVFLTGEIGYHTALDLQMNGVCCIEAGHAATEIPSIFTLADTLQKRAEGVQYNLRVICSASCSEP